MYEQQDVVSYYVKWRGLLPPEISILSELREWLSGKAILDIGVGGGRTTEALCELGSTYMGIDVSENMITACRESFGGRYNNCKFTVCDVRSMGSFADHSYDFILFSFNGLDALSVSDRTLALREVKRVGRKSGYFCFSAHNIQCIPAQLRPAQVWNPIKYAWRVYRWLSLAILNKGYLGLQAKPYAMVYDGAHRLRIPNYYVKPDAQISQLQQLGFRNIRVLLEDGSEVQTTDELLQIRDWWLYYLCEI